VLAATAVPVFLFAASAAHAGKRIYSYDSATQVTREMTKSGLTFVFEKSIMGTRVLSLMETHDIGAADVRPASAGDVGRGGLSVLGPDAHEHDVYEIVHAKDGAALIRALCPGADRAWLVFGPIRPDRDLRVDAVSRDAATGRSHLCVALDYNFHGQWALPPPDLPQPSRADPFNDAPANRRY
jgi:hypothetical protein